MPHKRGQAGECACSIGRRFAGGEHHYGSAALNAAVRCQQAPIETNTRPQAGTTASRNRNGKLQARIEAHQTDQTERIHGACLRVAEQEERDAGAQIAVVVEGAHHALSRQKSRWARSSNG